MPGFVGLASSATVPRPRSVQLDGYYTPDGLDGAFRYGDGEDEHHCHHQRQAGRVPLGHSRQSRPEVFGVVGELRLHEREAKMGCRSHRAKSIAEVEKQSHLHLVFFSPVKMVVPLLSACRPLRWRPPTCGCLKALINAFRQGASQVVVINKPVCLFKIAFAQFGVVPSDSAASPRNQVRDVVTQIKKVDRMMFAPYADGASVSGAGHMERSGVDSNKQTRSPDE